MNKTEKLFVEMQKFITHVCTDSPVDIDYFCFLIFRPFLYLMHFSVLFHMKEVSRMRSIATTG